MRSIRLSLMGMVVPSLLIFSTITIGCGAFWQPSPDEKPVVIPSDREVTEVAGRPGWFTISAGHLRELRDDRRLCIDALEGCQKKCP